jgi:hypothetical protein
MLEVVQTSIRSTPTSARLGGTPEPGPIDISEDCVEETDGYWETNRRSLKDLFYSRLVSLQDFGLLVGGVWWLSGAWCMTIPT